LIRKKHKRLLFFVLTALLMLGLLEAGSRLLLHVVPLWWRIPGNEELGYIRTWLDRRTNPGNVYFQFDQHHPVRGWTLQPNLRNAPAFAECELNSNSRGLRGITEFTYERVPGTKRVLLVGDSFTFGEGVSDGETYADYLREALPGTEVLNFGTHGYGHDQILLYFQEEGVKYRPDAVVLGYVSMDIERNLYKFWVYAKPKYVLIDGELRLTNVPVPRPEHVVRDARLRSGLFDLTAIFYRGYRWKQGVGVEEMSFDGRMTLARALLRELVDTARGIGARPVFLYIPAPYEVRESVELTYLPDEHCMNMCMEWDVDCLSLMPYFAEYPDEVLAQEIAGHWRGPVNRIIGQRLARFLETRILNPTVPRQPYQL